MAARSALTHRVPATAHPDRVLARASAPAPGAAAASPAGADRVGGARGRFQVAASRRRSASVAASALRQLAAVYGKSLVPVPLGQAVAPEQVPRSIGGVPRWAPVPEHEPLPAAL